MVQITGGKLGWEGAAKYPSHKVTGGLEKRKARVALSFVKPPPV
jgi:hypothetical protein